MAMTHSLLALVVLGAAAMVGTAPASACSALNGTTTYDSKFVLTGDPFMGGNWANARNNKAWIQRTLPKPVKLFGFYLGSGGSDITTVGSKIKVSARLTSGVWKSLLELSEVDVERPISGSGNIIAPVTVRFSAITVNALRVDLSGNGWFSLDRSLFFVEGCSGY